MNNIKISGTIEMICPIKGDSFTKTIRQPIHVRDREQDHVEYWLVFWGVSAIERLENFRVGDFIEIERAKPVGFVDVYHVV